MEVVGVKILAGKPLRQLHPKGTGKFFFTMTAALAGLERPIIHERTLAGLVAFRSLT